jgi:hypothetical protein
MQRSLTFAAILLLTQLNLISGQAQKATPKSLPGRWVGSMHSGHGDQQVKAIFKQEKTAYSGTMTWMDGSDKSLNNVKLEGNTVTAETEIEIPDGKMKISYILTLKGDTLEGVIMGGSGHPFEIDIKLKRAAE